MNGREDSPTIKLTSEPSEVWKDKKEVQEFGLLGREGFCDSTPETFLLESYLQNSNKDSPIAIKLF